MKKAMFYCCCTLLFIARAGSAYAQEDSLFVDSFPNYSFRTIIDSCFKHVDLSPAIRSL